MDKIARIRQEIERRRDICKAIFERESDTYYQGKAVAYDETLSFLDTLSEEPDKSLEEAARHSEILTYPMPDDGDIEKVMKVQEARIFHEIGFKAGAEWQASQMPMPEDTVLFNKGVAEGRRLEREDMLKDAVEADVNTYKDPVLSCGWAEFVVDMPSSETDKFGNKVRIIVLKEEEE